MTDVERELREAFERRLGAVDVAPVLPALTQARARRGKRIVATLTAGGVAAALVASAVAVAALRSDAPRVPRPATVPTRASYVAIFPGGAYGLGVATVTADSDDGSICFDGNVWDATAAYLHRSSPEGAERGPVITVATFYEDETEPPFEACAPPDRRTAAGILEDPAAYFLDFHKGDRSLAAPLQAPPQTEVPAVADVVCTDEGVEVLTPEVAAQPDGVHLRIDNRTSGGPKEFYVRGDDASSNQAGNIRPGINTVNHHVGPGPLHVGCFDRLDAPYGDLEDFGTVTVVDPAGLWTPAELVCGAEAKRRNVYTDAAEPAERRYDPPDYDAVARAWVDGLLPGDELERPGYPGTLWKAEPRSVVRDGERIASLTFITTRADKWRILVGACPGSGIEGV